MALRVYERAFESALNTLAAPTVNISSLTSATQAALLLQSITVLAACVIDASLENGKRKNTILFKLSQSFQAYQIADRAMLKIKINLDFIPHLITFMVAADAKPEDEGSTYLKNCQKEHIAKILHICIVEASKARQSFGDTMKLIEEMTHVAAELPEEIHYLIMKVLGKVHQHWSVLLNFFSTFESVAIGQLTERLKIIIQMENLSDSGIVRKSMAKSIFKGVAISISVARSADIYNQINEQYMRSLIAESIEKLTMSKEEAKRELSHLESKMQKVTEESRIFLEEKLKDAENEAIQEMMRFKKELFAALSLRASRLRLR